MKRYAVVTVAVGVLAVAGCAGEGTVTEAPTVEGAAESDGATSESAEPSDEAVEPSENDPAGGEPAEDPVADGESAQNGATQSAPDLSEDFEQVPAETDAASFGETVAWDDGISLSVSEPEPYEPTSSAAGTEGYDEAVRFTVTVTNETEEDLSLLFLFATVTSADTEGAQIFDYGGGLEFSFDDVAPGESAEVEQAHAVNDAEDVLVTISPDIFYDEVQFS